MNSPMLLSSREAPRPNTPPLPSAAAAWRHVAPALARMRLFRETDRHALIRYCLRLARWNDSRNKVDEGGAVYETESNHGRMLRVSPHFMVLERLEKGLLEYEDRFGMNPAARQRILAAMASAQPGLPLTPAPNAAPPSDSEVKPSPSPIGALGRGRALLN